MGVPKFFRYISERYPCLSELLKEYQIPEFDNLYLDMNGIIHVCSHPDDSNPHFRITEEKIFNDIFHYIEVLFRMIKPLKVFYMAIDGVAPRAKMNQQRGRRFRSAKEAERAEAKATESGEVLPAEARFDSNCITPGTEFMAKLHEQLKYFVTNKISTDPLWQKCKVIFSGHETPGEGEHKIMEYIRHARSQPGYNPNTRHCLYGLDADLIMLGLCTHEPHFSLLREEVKFGNKSQVKRKNVPEYMKFYLLHLSLMREYLELEFQPVKEKLSFPFDIENLIDDWVLMGFLVGNDFIPNLPNMHINNGALPLIYDAYMKVLPTLDGYINEAGTLHLSRFQIFLDHLSKIDLDKFNDEYADLKYFGEKKKISLMTTYEDVVDKMKKYLSTDKAKKKIFKFLDFAESSDDDSSTKSTADYGDELFLEEFQMHKRGYYMEKMKYEQVTPEVMKSQAEGYVRAIQWNLNYYYNGVCSWSWYYPHHYAPYISDVKKFSDVDFNFELGEPFKPFEQLLGVLPPASKNLLPTSYHHLMTDDNSILKKFYPDDFDTDLNGKQQEWEAVVLVPFIDEVVLLEAMKPCNNELTIDEANRNKHGPMIIYNYTELDLGEYKAPTHFNTITNNHAEFELVYLKDIQVPREKLIKGAYPGVKFDVYYPGFPTMKHLKYTGTLQKSKVKVFEQPSRNPNMMLIIEESENKTLEIVVSELLGKTVYAGWPHLVEAMVVSVSNENYKYHAVKDGKYNVETNRGNLQEIWFSEVQSFTDRYKDRMGIIVGEIDIMVHVKLMTGRKCFFTTQGRITYEKQWSSAIYPFPLQTIVNNISSYNALDVPYKNVEELFPVGSSCFMLGQPHYGCMGKVLDSRETLKKGRLKLEMYVAQEPDFTSVHDLQKNLRINYMSLYDASVKLGISKYLLSRLTGTILVLPDYMKDSKCSNGPRVNIGLNLKFNKKNEEIPGYTKKVGNTWYYSDRVINVMKSYMDKFPVVFGFLSANSNRDEYYYNELFPGDNANERVQEIGNWIKNLDYMKIERKSCGLCMLEPEVVKLLENVIDECQKNNVLNTKVTMQVKPFLLYNSHIQTSSLSPDPNSTFELFDRVVNVRPSYTVPVGHVGTIIALHKAPDNNDNDVLYDVVFDSPFLGGLDVGCSTNRGYRLPRIALINKSYGQRQFNEKTGKSTQQTGNQNQRSINVQAPSTSFPRHQNLAQHNQANSAFVSCWQNQRPKLNQQWNQKRPNSQNPNDFANKFVPTYQVNASQPNHNFFMPSFSNNKNVQNKEPNENKVDTDFLKKMLGININSQGDKKSTSTGGGNTSSQAIQEKQDTYAIQLTRYYQSKDLGLPRYHYYPYVNNQFICQLKTIDGNMLCSEPKARKEDACENVAAKYMQLLRPDKKSIDIKLPVPPKQWCQTNNNLNSKQEHLKESQIATSSKSNNPTNIPPFVPLQAVRQQKNKGQVLTKSGNVSNTIKNDTFNENDGLEHAKDNNTYVDDTDMVNKPKRERKIRIAANFANSMTN